MYDKPLRSLCTAAWCVAFVAGCSKSSAPPDAASAPPHAANPVARVNGVELSRQAFDRDLDKSRQRFAQAGREIPPALELRLKESTLRKLVDDALVAQRAKAEGISVTAAELDTQLLEFKARFGSPEGFKSFLERTGQREDDVREELQRTELRERLFGKLASIDGPADAEVKAFYEKNRERYVEREQVRVLQVMWRSERADPAAVRKKVEARARAAAAELKKKGVDFKAKIATWADAAPSPNEGELGWVQRGRQLEPIEDAIFAPTLKAGDLVGPIETELGFHVLKVLDRRPERQKPLAEVAADVRGAIDAYQKSKRSRDLMAELERAARVEVLEPGLSLEAALAPDSGEAPTAPDAAR